MQTDEMTPQNLWQGTRWMQLAIKDIH